MKKGVQFSSKHEEIFFETQQVWTPQLDSAQEVAYRDPSQRNVKAVAPPSTLSRPNYEDILRRVSMVIQQHITKCEYRMSLATSETDELFHKSKMREFEENNYLQPQYVYHFVRAPVSRLGFLYGIKQHTHEAKVPNLNDIYSFLRGLFIKAQLSPECSIVCLIYVERLMEMAHVPLVARTWRPCLLCGLLLASKVWQDLSSWNSEFSQVYPEFSLEAINEMEIHFCKNISWNLYISSSAYAKYYFALRSLSEKKDFRRNYNSMVVNAPGAQLVEERSGEVRQSVLDAMTLSRSL